MRNLLSRAGYAFSGVVVAVCLTVVAYMIAGRSLSQPASTGPAVGLATIRLSSSSDIGSGPTRT